MRRALDFYRQWGKMILLAPIAIAERVGFFVAIFTPAIVQIVPSWRHNLDSLGWQIPLGILSTGALIRISLAPYWIYKNKKEELVKVVQDLQSKLKEQQKEYDFRRQQLIETRKPYLEPLSDLVYNLKMASEKMFDVTVVNKQKDTIVEAYHLLEEQLNKLKVEDDSWRAYIAQQALAALSDNKINVAFLLKTERETKSYWDELEHTFNQIVKRGLKADISRYRLSLYDYLALYAIYSQTELLYTSKLWPDITKAKDGTERHLNQVIRSINDHREKLLAGDEDEPLV